MIPQWLIAAISSVPILSILTYLWNRNNAYGKIIEEFREKLPRPQNQAQVLTSEQVKANPIFPESFQHITVINTGTQRVSISDVDLDAFYNKLVNFDYRFVLFAGYYRKYTKNLLRFHPKTDHNNFDLAVLQRVLQRDDELHPTKFIYVLKYHLKWEIPPFKNITEYLVRRSQMRRAAKIRQSIKNPNHEQ